MIDIIKKKLAPHGVLRVGVNMSNFLLVSSINSQGLPEGISPDIAKEVAKKLNVECEFIQFDTPGELADAVGMDIWDIGNIAFQLKRALTINFSDPYINIDANFLFRKTDLFKTNEDINKVGVKILVFKRSAYDLWLTDNFHNAELIRLDSIQLTHDMFKQGKGTVLASLKPKLLEELDKNKNYKIINKPFTCIKQCIGINKSDPDVIKFLNDLIFELISNGFIESSLERHKVKNKLTIPHN